MAPHLLELTHDIWQVLTGDIPELRGDDIVEKLLDASVQENVATLLHMFEHGLVPDNIQAPRPPRSSTPAGWPSAACRLSPWFGPTASATAGSSRGASMSSPEDPPTPTWRQP